MAHKTLRINFPYYLYPGTPFGGYYSVQFNAELIRLTDHIIELRGEAIKQKRILFHLTIGAPMEEFVSEIGINKLKQENVLFQMHQLVPDHLLQAAKNGIHVENCIVCPNKITEPMFMMTNEYKQIDEKTYMHTDLPITMHIFNTMMPTKDEIRNKKFMDYVELEQKNEPLFCNYAKTHHQNEDDCKFVDIFYNELRETVRYLTISGCLCTCFSFAVFRSNGKYGTINNMEMFKEIKNSIYDENMIYEWLFINSQYIVRCVHSSKDAKSENHKRMLCYVPPHKLPHINDSKICQIVPSLDHNGNIKCLFIQSINTKH